MLSRYGRKLVAQPIAPLIAYLRRAGITPNTITYIGFILTAFSALFLATGYFRTGGILLLAAAFFDMLDGSLARATEQSSDFGAFLDSTLDRYSESITFLALVYYYSSQIAARTELVLIFFILVGSLMVSYTRARAEGLSIECKAGILQRPERIILLIAGLITGWILPILWALAILTNITAIQRIMEVYWRTHSLSPPTVPQAASGRDPVGTEDNHPIQG